MLRLIRKIRRQPRHVRDNIALSIAGVFTVLVAALWAWHLPGSLTSKDETGEQTPFFSQLRSSLEEQMATVRSSVESVDATNTPAANTETSATNTRETNFTLSEENKSALASSSAAAVSSSSAARANSTSSEPSTRSIRIATTSRASSSASTTNP